MKKYIVDFLIVAIPFLLILAGVNFFVDPAHKFDNDYEQNIVDILCTGSNATNVDNCSERKLKNILIEKNSSKHFDWAVYSSSRGMTISSIETGANLINLGVSSATIMDFIAIDYLCGKDSLSYDKLILVLDPYYLCDAKQNERWKENESLYNEALGKDAIAKSDKWSLSDLFSPTYFQASFKLLLLGKKKLEKTDDVDNSGQTVVFDGSISYPERIRNKAQGTIDYEAGQNKSDVYTGYVELSDSLCSQFEILLDRLHKRGVSVTFYEAPMHPAVYDNIKNIQGIQLQEKYFREQCAKYGISIIGSFNPAECECDNTSFYDADHMRRDVINKIVKESIIVQ